MAEEEPLRLRDVVIAGIITLAIVGAALLSDAGVRTQVRRAIQCDPIQVAISSGYGESSLRVPLTGVNATATSGNLPVAARFTLYSRESPGAPWGEFSTHSSDTGTFIFVLSPTTETTEAYVRVEPDDAGFCNADSSVLHAVVGAPANPTLPPAQEPGVAEPTPAVTPTIAPPPLDCANVTLEVRNGFGEGWLRVPVSGVDVRVSGMGEHPYPASYTLFVREGDSTFREQAALHSTEGRVMFTLGTTNDTMAFVQVDFRPGQECVKNSSVLRAAPTSSSTPP